MMLLLGKDISVKQVEEQFPEVPGTFGGSWISSWNLAGNGYLCSMKPCVGEVEFTFGHLVQLMARTFSLTIGQNSRQSIGTQSMYKTAPPHMTQGHANPTTQPPRPLCYVRPPPT